MDQTTIYNWCRNQIVETGTRTTWHSNLTNIQRISTFIARNHCGPTVFPTLHAEMTPFARRWPKRCEIGQRQPHCSRWDGFGVRNGTRGARKNGSLRRRSQTGNLGRLSELIDDSNFDWNCHANSDYLENPSTAHHLLNPFSFNPHLSQLKKIPPRLIGITHRLTLGPRTSLCPPGDIHGHLRWIALPQKGTIPEESCSSKKTAIFQALCQFEVGHDKVN